MQEVRIVRYYTLLQYTGNGSNKFYEVLYYALENEDGSRGPSMGHFRHGRWTQAANPTGGRIIPITGENPYIQAMEKAEEKMRKGYSRISMGLCPPDTAHARYVWHEEWTRERKAAKEAAERAEQKQAAAARLQVALEQPGSAQLFG